MHIKVVILYITTFVNPLEDVIVSSSIKLVIKLNESDISDRYLISVPAKLNVTITITIVEIMTLR